VWISVEYKHYTAYAFMDINVKYVDMDVGMGVKFHIHGNSAKFVGDSGHTDSVIATSYLNCCHHDV